MKVVGIKIKKLCDTMGITQVQLAGACGIAPCTLSLIIAERRGTSDDVITRIAGVLGVPVEVLCTEDEDTEFDRMVDAARRSIPGFHLPSFKAGLNAAAEGHDE